MTLDFQATLPEELAQKITQAANERGLPLWEFLTLLLGLFSLPQMRLSEDPVIRDLSDELMLYCQRRAAALEQANNKILSLQPDLFTEKPSPEWIADELKTWRTPQSLEELKPPATHPPGMTAIQFKREQRSGDETEEEMLETLKQMG
jgi:hypothetical protein